MSGNFLLIVPTYNEAENIELFLDEVFFPKIDILVVDDNSPDGTSDLVANKIKKNSSTVSYTHLTLPTILLV